MVVPPIAADAGFRGARPGAKLWIDEIVKVDGSPFAGFGSVDLTPYLTIETAASTYQIIVSGVSDAEIGYLNGVTSAIQTQIDSKLATATAASTYQPLDADLTSWAAITRAAGFDTFATTPSSANLAAAVTGETGSGALVFATSPGFTTAANPVSNDGASLGISGTAWSDLFLASGAVINFNAGDVTVTHSSNTLAFAGASSGYTFDAALIADGSGSYVQWRNAANSTAVTLGNASGFAGIWLQANESNARTTANYSFLAVGGQSIFNSQSGSNLSFRIANANVMECLSSGGVSITGQATISGKITNVPSSSVTLGTNGQFEVEMTSNTAGNLVYRGSDGTTRRMALVFV